MKTAYYHKRKENKYLFPWLHGTLLSKNSNNNHFPVNNILILNKTPLLKGEKLENTKREQLFHSWIRIKWD